MKKLLYTLLIVNFLFLGMSSQIVKKVPENIETKFTDQFPTAQKITWKVFKDEVMVVFNKDDVRYEIWYKNNSDIIMLAYSLKKEQLPQKIKHYLDSAYSSITYDAIGVMIDAKSDTTYQAKGEIYEKKRHKIKYKAVCILFLHLKSQKDLK